MSYLGRKGKQKRRCQWKRETSQPSLGGSLLTHGCSSSKIWNKWFHRDWDSVPVGHSVCKPVRDSSVESWVEDQLIGKRRQLIADHLVTQICRQTTMYQTVFSFNRDRSQTRWENTSQPQSRTSCQIKTNELLQIHQTVPTPIPSQANVTAANLG